MTEPADDYTEWGVSLPRWLIAEKVRIESPFFSGDMIVEDVVKQTHNTVTYKMVSADDEPVAPLWTLPEDFD